MIGNHGDAAFAVLNALRCGFREAGHAGKIVF
jgi:hypothetical protein